MVSSSAGVYVMEMEAISNQKRFDVWNVSEIHPPALTFSLLTLYRPTVQFAVDELFGMRGSVPVRKYSEYVK